MLEVFSISLRSSNAGISIFRFPFSGCQVVFFHGNFLYEVLYLFLICPMRATFTTQLILLD